MKKFLKKITVSFMTILMLLSSTTVVSAAVKYKLYRNDILPKVLDLSPIRMDFVQYLNIEQNNNGVISKTPAWCVEPTIPTKVGTDYIKYPATSADKGYNIIVNWHKNYSKHKLYDTAAGYYAVQTAIWSTFANYDPINLKTAPGAPTQLANEIRTLASELYYSKEIKFNSFLAVDGIEKIVGGGSVDLGDISKDKIYRLEGKKYWRTPLITIGRNIGANEQKFYIDKQPGVVITSANYYHPLPEENGKIVLGNKSPDGNSFYAFVPIEQAGNTTLNISTDFEYMTAAKWDGGIWQDMMSLDFRNKQENYTLSFSWRGPKPEEPVTEYTGSLEMVKTGMGPKTATVSTNYQNTGYELYTITNGMVPLSDATFSFYVSSSGISRPATPYSVNSDINGSIHLDNIRIKNNEVLTEQFVGQYIKYRICEDKTPEGYYLSSNDVWISDSTGDKCVYVTAFTKDGKNFEFKNSDFKTPITNTPKDFKVNIHKTDELGRNVAGVGYGLFTTEAINTTPIVPAGAMVAYGKTDTSGNLVLGEGLPTNQNYVLKELSAPVNYDPEIYEAKIDGVKVNVVDNGIDIDLRELNASNETTKTFNVDIVNQTNIIEKNSYDLIIKKIDQNGQPVAHAEIVIYSKGEEVARGTTTGTGDLSFTLPEEAYTIVEEVIPNGYLKAEDQAVYLDKNTTVTMYDNKDTTTVSITKNLTNEPSTGTHSVSFLVRDHLSNIEKTIDISGNPLSGKSATFDVKIGEPGDYRYTITEKAGSPYMTHDTSSYEISYKIIKDANGKALLDGNITVVKTTPSGSRETTTHQDFSTINLVFNNDYKSSGMLNLNFKKAINGKTDETKPFTLVLTQNNQNPVEINVNSPAYQASYSIPLNKTGHFTVEVKEKDLGYKDYIFDKTVYTVQYDVVDDGQGKLSATNIKLNGASYNGNPITFTNTHINDGLLTIELQKVIEGKNDETRPFTFVVNSSTQVSEVVAKSPSYKTSYNIPLNKTGHYSVMITEKDLGYDKYTFDKTSYEVEYDVVIEGNKLVAKNVKVNKVANDLTKPLVFTNTYNSTGVFSFELQKNIQGKNDETRPFIFIVEKDGKRQEVEISRPEYKSTYSVPLIKEGHETIIVSEKDLGYKDYIFDKNQYTIEYDVVNDGKGNLVATNITVNKKTYDIKNPIVFTNNFINPTTYQFDITKNYVGGGTDNKEFKFQVRNKIDNSLVETVTINPNVDKVATIKPIKLDKVAKYEFEVKETSVYSDVIEDQSTFIISFETEIINNQYALKPGSLKITKDNVATDKVEFTNYKVQPSQVNININKIINGNYGTDFVDGYNPENTTFKANVRIYNKDTNENVYVKRVDFSKLTPSKLQAVLEKEGNYIIEVSEINDGLNSHFIYDKNVYSKEFRVIRNNNVLTVDGDNNFNFTFTNTYNPTSAKAKFGVFKTVVGDKYNELDKFTFEVADETGKVIDKFDIKASNTKKEVKEINLTFDKTGTYKYTITETGIISDVPDWYLKPTKHTTVTVNVVDNRGILEATVVSDNANNEFEIINNYKEDYKPIEGIISLSKITNTNKKDKFTFDVSKDGQQVGVIEADANGKPATITVELDREGKHNFVVLERVNQEDKNYEYDTKEHIVTFYVAKQNYKYVINEIQIDGKKVEKAELTIVNKYNWDPVETDITFTKEFKNYTGGNKKHNFVFELSDGQTVTITNPIGVVEEKFNLTFDKPGIYKYTLKEVKDDNDSVIKWDEKVREIIFTVTDENGVLKVKRTGDTLDFVNVYKTPDPVKASFEVEKILEIKDEKPTEDKVFNFKVGEEIFSIKGAGKTTFTFENEFTEGEYDFELTEVDDKYDNYTFSTEKYRVHVSVTLDENDILVSNVTIYKGDKEVEKAVFTNTYSYTTPPTTPKPSTPIPDTAAIL